MITAITGGRQAGAAGKQRGENGKEWKIWKKMEKQQGKVHISIFILG